MDRPHQITFRDFEPIDSVRSYVERRIEKLETFHPHIVSCHVTLSRPHRHKQHGGHFRVAIDLKIPGELLVVDGDGAAATPHEDLSAAVDDAFESMKRALKDRAQKLRGAARFRARVTS